MQNCIFDTMGKSPARKCSFYCSSAYFKGFSCGLSNIFLLWGIISTSYNHKLYLQFYSGDFI